MKRSMLSLLPAFVVLVLAVPTAAQEPAADAPVDPAAAANAVRDPVAAEPQATAADRASQATRRNAEAPEDGPTAGAEVEKAPPFAASLLLVKADWSKVPAAKEIETELRKALEGVPVPQELLDKLPASGPQILFPPKIVSLYSAKDAAELLAWLNAKGLLDQKQITPLAISETHEDGPNSPSLMAIVSKPYELLDLPPLPPDPTGPFMTREPQFYWSVKHWGGEPFQIRRQFGVTNQFRGQGGTFQALDESEFALNVASEQVAIVNAFPGGNEALLREAARRKGYEVLLTVEPTNKPGWETSNEPKLHLPDKVSPIDVERSMTNTWLQEAAADAHSQAASAQPAHSAEAGANAEPASGDQSPEETVVFRLNSADVLAVEPMLNRLFPGKLKVIAQNRGPLGRKLIVRGPRTTIERVAELIKFIDKEAESVGAADATEKAESDNEGSALKVFDLQHASATSVKDTLWVLYQDRIFGGALDFGAEPSVNRLIVRGTPKNIEEVEALVKAIDRPAADSGEASSSGGMYGFGMPSGKARRPKPAAQARGSRGSPDDLRHQYDALERKAAEMARELRGKRGSSPRGSEASDELRKVVAQAFTIRHLLHQAELDALEARLQSTRETLAMRERIQRAIIDRRVEDLLNPALDWDAPVAAGGQGGSRDVGASTLSAARTYVETLRERWQLLLDLYKQGQGSLHDTLRAGSEYFAAAADAAKTADDRRDALEKQVEQLEQLKEAVETLYEGGQAAKQALLAVEAEVLKAKANLAAETATATPNGQASSAGAPAGSELGIEGIPVQVQLYGPEGMEAKVPYTDDSPSRLPTRIGATTGKAWNLTLSRIPGHEGLTLYGTLAIAAHQPATKAFVEHSAIPLTITTEDIDQADSGNFVTKVVYLPRPEEGLTAPEVQTLVSTRLDPGLDPLAEANRRGFVLAVFSLTSAERRGDSSYAPPGETSRAAGQPPAGDAGESALRGARGDGVLILHQPEEIQERLSELHHLVDSWRKQVSEREQEVTVGKAEQRSLDNAKLQLRSWQNKFDLALAQHEAQIELLESNLQEAEAVLEAADRDLERVEALHEAKAVSNAEYEKHKLPVERARRQVERAQTLLGLYKNIRYDASAPAEENASDAKAGPAPAGPPAKVDAAARREAAGNIAAVTQALMNYLDDHKRFPPAVIFGKDGKGKVPHSWRVEILPYMSQQALYDEYRFDEPWDSEHNLALVPKMPAVFRSPLDARDSTNASYFALVTPGLRPIMSGAEMSGADAAGVPPAGGTPSYHHGTAFSNPAGTRLHDITDGTSNAILLVEAKREIPWTRPHDIPYIPSPEQPLPQLGGWFPEGWHASFADGAVKFLANDNDEATLRALFTIGAGENVKPKVVGR